MHLNHSYLQDIVYVDELNNECTILAPKPSKMYAQTGGNPNKSITFSFDRCYNANTNTAGIYNEIPYSLVQVRPHHVIYVQISEYLMGKKRYLRPDFLSFLRS